MARVYKGYDDRYSVNAGCEGHQQRFRRCGSGRVHERFRREARAIARLHHPNIVGVYQFGEYEGNYYMAMVFIEGKDLRQILKENAESGKALPMPEVLNFIRGIGSALDYAHSRGVIHRDIKPSISCSITRTGRSDRFRAGHSARQKARSAIRLAAHTILHRNRLSRRLKPCRRAISTRSGVCLYEMLAGKVPFDDPSAMSVALKHLNDAPPPPTMYNPELSPPLSA